VNDALSIMRAKTFGLNSRNRRRNDRSLMVAVADAASRPCDVVNLARLKFQAGAPNSQ
jgi:hypothetical protein